MAPATVPAVAPAPPLERELETVSNADALEVDELVLLNVLSSIEVITRLFLVSQIGSVMVAPPVS